MKLKSKRGISLAEVLISISIVSILIGLAATIFVQYSKVNMRIKVKENVISEITDIYNLFTSNPGEFADSLEIYLNKEIDFDSEDSFKIYYSKKFILEKLFSQTNNYLSIEYRQDQGEDYILYILKIIVYYNGDIYKINDETSKFERTIKLAKEA